MNADLTHPAPWPGTLQLHVPALSRPQGVR